MGCCESSRYLENEVQISDKPMRESDFVDISLDGPEIFRGFDFEGIHSNKSTCQTNRLESIFVSTGFLNNIS